MKRILYVHHGGSQGGAPRSLMYTIRQIDKSCFEPYVLCISDERNIQMFQSVGAKVYFDKRIKPFHGSTASIMSWKQKVKNVLGIIPSVVCIWRYIKELKPDLVHLNSTCLCFVAAGIRLHSDIPIVFHIREPILNNIWGNVIRKVCKKCATQFIAIDNYDLQSMKLDPATKRKNIVYNFVDFDLYNRSVLPIDVREKYAIGKEKIVFLYLARITPYNGIKEMLEALRDNSIKGAFFLVAGFYNGQGFEGEVLKIIESLPNVGWMKFIDDVPALLSAADVLVCPFVEPHFARSIIEAAAMGKPSIASNIQGPDELVINNVTGILFDPNNFNTFSDACKKFVDNPELIEKMGKAAEVFAHENFDAKKNVARIEEIYGDILS